MSSVHLIIRDEHREVNGECHAGFADAVIAALSAQPETIEELDAALERFIARGAGSFFRLLRNGAIAGPPDTEPFDAGVAFVDLAARLVMSDSTYSSPLRAGYMRYHDGRSLTEIEVAYHLSSDWEFVGPDEGWRHRAERRRRERRANPPRDVRAIIFGEPLLEYIARECWDHFRGRGGASTSDRADGTEATERDEQDAETIRGIHARWLLTSRDDLGGMSPREAMLDRHDYVAWSLQDREEQWSQTRQCPRGLDPGSAAYRFAGFGTTEMVVYYDLVRGLLWSCREAAASRLEPAGAADETCAAEFVQSEVPRLASLREAWLDAPDPEYNGRTPRELVHNERARIPEGSSGEALMIDCDCPLCQMEASSGNVAFWHLDGSHMDEDFAFSISHKTLEDWREDQRRHEEFDRTWREREARRRLGIADEADDAAHHGPWRSSFSTEPSADDPPLVRLFAIGSHLGELINDLKEREDARDLIDRLNRDFGNVLEVADREDDAEVEALLGPAVARFAETLDVVAAARRDLDPKCDDLRRRARLVVEPRTEPEVSAGEEEDLPW